MVEEGCSGVGGRGRAERKNQRSLFGKRKILCATKGRGSLSSLPVGLYLVPRWESTA